MNFHWKDCCWSWSSNTLATWCKKNWLIWKDHDARKGWRQEEKGMAEEEMVGWHHWLALEFEQALGVGDRQGSLACNIPGGLQRFGHNWGTELNCSSFISMPSRSTFPSPDSSKNSWEVRLFSAIFLNISPASIHYWLQNPCVVMGWIPSKSCMLKSLPPVWFHLVIGSLREIVKIKWGCQDAS